MTGDGLGGVPRFLHLLTDFPEPKTVLSALIDDVLFEFDVRAGALWALHDDDLVLVESVGLMAAEVRRYRILPRRLDLNIWQSVRDSKISVLLTDVDPKLEFTALDAPHWTAVMHRLGAVDAVRAPLGTIGMHVGALGLLAGRPWEPLGTELLETLTGPLSLWLTNPESGCLTAASEAHQRIGDADLALSERQGRIAALIRSGLSNTEIADRLGVSGPTVKLDLAALMRATSSNDRRVAAERAFSLGLVRQDADQVTGSA